MIVKVKNLKNDLDRLNKFIDEYNITILNLYNELLYSQNYWNDPKALRFYDNARFEKNKNLQIINELNDLKTVYNYITNSYSEFGNVINCSLENKSNVINAIDRYINNLNNVIKQYKKLDYSFCTLLEKNYLDSELRKLNSCSKDMFNIRNKINDYFNKIEEIERNVNFMIQKIDVTYLKENEIVEYL